MIEIYAVLYCFDVMNFRGQYPFEYLQFSIMFDIVYSGL